MGRKKRIVSVFMLMVSIFMTLQNEKQNHSSTYINAETETSQNETEVTHWYTQKNWTYNEKKLTSMCYITSYAMVLSNMGIEANPVDVYVANGCSSYVVHSKIAKTYGVSTSETGTIKGSTVEEKTEFIRNLLKKYPQGIIVGGSYGNGTHYIVAKKVEDGEVYFDDPAFATAEEGCCIPVSKIYKHTWKTLTKYRVVKYEEGAETTMAPVTTVTSSAIPMKSESPIVKPTGMQNTTVTPSSIITPEHTSTLCPTTTVEVTYKPERTIIPTEIPTTCPATTVGVTCIPESTTTPIVSPTTGTAIKIETTLAPTPSVYNPLGKYQVPTRTVYYKKPIMKGEDVKWVECALKTLGYNLSIDGKYSKTDKKIAIKYQKKNGLSPDGFVGENTRNQIIKDLEITFTNVKKVNGVKIEKNEISKNSVSEKSIYQAFVTWKHMENVDGYVLVYSTNKKFSSKKRMQLKRNRAELYGLKKNKRYYVKVRAFKEVNGKKIYGAFSNVRKCKW